MEPVLRNLTFLLITCQGTGDSRELKVGEAVHKAGLREHCSPGSNLHSSEHETSLNCLYRGPNYLTTMLCSCCCADQQPS